MDLTIRTSRLLLRPQVESDIPAIVAGLNDYGVTGYLTVVPYPYTDADATAWIAMQQPARPGAAQFAIDLPGTGLIGVVGIGKELGYWLGRRHHGHGYMTEASEALLDWHFALLPHSVVPSGAHVGNEASLRVQKKLGFVDTGVRDKRFVASQRREVEHVNTSLVRADFEAARKSLRRD